MRVALIADDLSGASDAAMGFARAGLSASVSFNAVPTQLSTQMLAVDTDSRTLLQAQAFERVLRIAQALRSAPLVYKKLDSTLRGHIALEVRAALEGFERQKLIFAPAFPNFERSTHEGVQLLSGQPIHETAFANDPRNPVRESHLPTLLSSLGALQVVSRAALQDGQMPTLLESHDKLVIDIQTPNDFQVLISQIGLREDVLWAGSTGLAYALGDHLTQGAISTAFTNRHARVLTIVGSVNAISRTQLQTMRGASKLRFVQLGEHSLEESRAALHRGESVVLHSADVGATPGTDTVSTTTVSTPIPDTSALEHEAARVVAALADQVANLEGLFDALVLTGGDTAIHIARKLGASGVHLERELETGVPYGHLIGPKPHAVVTKAGGFGTPQTLLNVLNTLRGSL